MTGQSRYSSENVIIECERTRRGTESFMSLKGRLGSSLPLAIAVTCSSLTIAAEPQQSPGTPPAAQAATTQPAVQPAIVADAAEHDFGHVRTGDKVEHRFKITNSGSAELRVRNGAA